MKPISRTIPAKIAVWFPSGKYFVRTIRREDASERWASWLADEETAYALNIQPKKYEKKDIATYIKQFDQRFCVLLGIFEKGTRLHIGIVRIDINYDAKEAILNAIIGDREHRNSGATAYAFVPTLDYIFDKLKLQRVKASVLRRNQVTLNYLLKAGWQIDHAPEHHVKSAIDGSMLEVVSLHYTRSAFHDWKQSRVGQRIVARLKRWTDDRKTGY